MGRSAAPIGSLHRSSSAALSIGAFLDLPELAVCDSAQVFSPYNFGLLWYAAGLKWVENIPLWKNAPNQFVENGLHGKELISTMISFRRAFHVPKERWRPWIVETSFHSIKATPHPSNFHEGHSEGTVGVHPTKPDRACVAVRFGTNRGQPLAVGIKFAAAGPVNDNLCIGVEAVGGLGTWPMMSISFAPFSGICFIEHDGLTMQTQALPIVPEVLEGCAWIHVTEQGGIRFLRQFEGGQLEDTGLLPPEMLHKSSQSYFASVDIWFSDLEVPVDVSVEHSGCAFPTNMPASNKHGVEMETTWAMRENA